MNQSWQNGIITVAMLVVVAGCQGEPADTGNMAAVPDDEVYQSPGKPNVAPVDVRYRLLDTPQVGQPFGLEISLVSNQATSSMGYTVDAESALIVDQRNMQGSFAGKPAMTPETTVLSITPAMEGRFYVRVSGNVIVNGQSQSRMVTIPIQVGQGSRQLEQIGEVVTDQDGNPVVSLPAKVDDD